MTEKLKLPPETLAKLKKANDIIKKGREYIARAKIAKMDTKRMEEQLNANEQQIRDIRDGFFPGETL